MADLPIPDWLARRITEAIRRSKSGSVALNWNEHRIQSFDLKEHDRVTHHEPCSEGTVVT